MKSIALTLAVLLSTAVCAQATAPAAKEETPVVEEKAAVDVDAPAGSDVSADVKLPEQK